MYQNRTLHIFSYLTIDTWSGSFLCTPPDEKGLDKYGFRAYFQTITKFKPWQIRSSVKVVLHFDAIDERVIVCKIKAMQSDSYIEYLNLIDQNPAGEEPIPEELTDPEPTPQTFLAKLIEILQKVITFIRSMFPKI